MVREGGSVRGLIRVEVPRSGGTLAGGGAESGKGGVGHFGTWGAVNSQSTYKKHRTLDTLSAHSTHNTGGGGENVVSVSAVRAHAPSLPLLSTPLLSHRSKLSFHVFHPTSWQRPRYLVALWPAVSCLIHIQLGDPRQCTCMAYMAHSL